MNKIFIVIVVIYSFALVSCSRGIVLTDQTWRDEDGICTVEFTIKNNTDNEAIRRIQITAYIVKDDGWRAIMSDIIAEKAFYIGLKPGEEKKWTGTIELFLGMRPSMVVIRDTEGKI